MGFKPKHHPSLSHLLFFFFGYDRCLKEVVGMAEVSCGSRRSKWVMAWVTEIGDRRSEWAEVGFWLFLAWVWCFWLWLWFLCLKGLWVVVGSGVWVVVGSEVWVVVGLWVRCLGRG